MLFAQAQGNQFAGFIQLAARWQRFVINFQIKAEGLQLAFVERVNKRLA